MRGEIYRLTAPRGMRGSKQAGSRFAVVVQSDMLPLSTWLVAPTSTAAAPATFRPQIDLAGRTTRVLAEQITAVDPSRLGEPAGYLSSVEMGQVDAALRLVLSP